MLYKSNKGGGPAVDFEEAILDGYAVDGGLYVPELLPQISLEQLGKWKDIGYKNLAFEILSLFIDRTIISEFELKEIISSSYDAFERKEVIPLHKLQSRENTYIMELFYGPTISFKDVGMSFVVNLVNFFLKRRQEHLSVIVATTGDTGPAAAHFIAGKSNLDGWILYPKGLITKEQERQMTTLHDTNIHSVSVANCPEGGDDLDAVVSKLYANKPFKDKLKLSSVNSLNWGRVMIQTVHYFYGYLRVVDQVGEEINVSVPSGGFGNLCAGGLARKMGLPVKNFIVANNKNACLHRTFSEGILSKEPIHATLSSAIDILVPINFWRYLYFAIGKDAQKIKRWIGEFEETGKVHFDKETCEAYRNGFMSISISDEQTLDTIKDIYEAENYLIDPHAAVSLAASDSLREKLADHKLICLATAHPAKFPVTIQKALGSATIPEAARHQSIESAKTVCQKRYECDYSHFESSLINAMETDWDLRMESN